MGKRKGRKDTAETSVPTHENGKNEMEEEEESKGGRFFACYLLTSLCPRFKGHTYIGFTVNPRRRIRQHNGEIGCGAWRTKRKRPWEMVICIYGFPTNVAALQFEWAWQHPVESLAVRTAAASFKSLSGLANKIKLAYTMLTLPAWQSLNLTVNFFSTKYQKHISGCPTLPKQMRSQVCSMDDLPCYNDNFVIDDDWDGDEEECDINITSQGPTNEVSTEETELLHNTCHSEENEYLAKEARPGLTTNSSPIREQNKGWSSIVNDTPDRMSLFASNYMAQDDVQTSTSDEHFSTDFDYTLKQSTTVLVSDKDEFSIKSPGVIGRQIEIIDLFTPSPRYAVRSGSKKRRPNLGTQIIDLTNSPMFVEV